MDDVTFLRAWQAWDTRPHDKVTAEKMEEASGEKAEEIGLPTHVFRDVLKAWRRAGLKRSESLLAVRAGAMCRSE